MPTNGPQLYLDWAKSMKMRNVFYVNGGNIGSIQIFQLPLTKEWLNGTRYSGRGTPTRSRNNHRV